MFTVNFQDGTLTIEQNGVVTHIQHRDPATGEVWVDETTARNWANEVITSMQGVLERKVSPLAYVRRFSLVEHAGILAAAKLDSTVEAVLKRTEMAKFIDLDDAEVRQGLELLAAGGLIEETRVDEIIGAHVLQHELP